MPALSPCSLLEAHLNVGELDRSIAFYSEVLGLELAHINKERETAFFWIGERGRSMLGLWAGSWSPNVMQLHSLFVWSWRTFCVGGSSSLKRGWFPWIFLACPRRNLPSLDGCLRLLSSSGDPDNHLLELLAMLQMRAPRLVL